MCCIIYGLSLYFSPSWFPRQHWLIILNFEHVQRNAFRENQWFNKYVSFSPLFSILIHLQSIHPCAALGSLTIRRLWSQHYTQSVVITSASRKAIHIGPCFQLLWLFWWRAKVWWKYVINHVTNCENTWSH